MCRGGIEHKVAKACLMWTFMDIVKEDLRQRRTVWQHLKREAERRFVLDKRISYLLPTVR